MPVNVASDIEDQLWSILEHGEETAALVRAGNRIKRTVEAGWLKERVSAPPADFPYLDVVVGEEFSDSAFRKDESFEMVKPDFLQRPDRLAWENDEDVSVRITAVSDRRDLRAVINLINAVRRDIKRAGPRLGLPDFVMSFTRMAGGTRFIAAGETTAAGAELPESGTIGIVRFTVETTQNGYDALGM